MRAAVVGFALITAVAAAAVLLTPKILERAGVRERLATQIGAQIGAHVELAAIRVSLLPLPHAVVDHVRLAVTPKVDATIESIAVYPKLRALLAGKLEPARVIIGGANVLLRLRREAAVEAAPRSDRTTDELRNALAAVLAGLSSATATRVSGLAVQVAESTVTITPADGPRFTITDVHGTIQLPPAQLGIDLAARSELCEQATLRGAIDPDSVHGNVVLVLTGLRPQLIDAHLSLPMDLRIGDAAVDLSVSVSANGLDALRADVDVTAPSLPLLRVGEKLTLKGVRMKAGVRMDGRNISVALNDVRMTDPPAQLSGTLALDQAVPQVRLDIEGSDLDVAQAHDAAVFFIGPNPTARAIFHVLEAGTVERLTLQAQSPALAELASSDALLIHGTLAHGKVRLPAGGLQLDDVSGEVSVAHGVLIGEHLAGRLGNTQAREGNIRVGLTDESRELFVSTAVQADVSDLPAVLKQVVKNDSLTRTLDRLTEVRGSAEGELTLSGTTDAVIAAVDVSTLSMSTRVRDLEEPVLVAGGQFHYGPEGLAASGLNVTTGDSSLSGVVLHVDTSTALSRIDVSGADGRIVLGKIYPWFVKSGWVPDGPWIPTKLAGTLAIASVHVQGPAAKPSDWRVELAGGVNKLDVDTPQLRQVLALRFPVSLSSVRLAHDPTATTLSMNVAAPEGLNGSIDAAWSAQGIDVKRLSVRDAFSNATLSLGMKERELDLSFRGKLETATLKAVLAHERDVPASMQGDFKAHVAMDRPARSTAKGRLDVIHLIVPGPGDLPLHIARAALRADVGLLSIDADGGIGDEPPMHLRGTLRPTADALIVDADVSAGKLEWARFEPVLSSPSESGDRHGRTGARTLPIRGKVRISAESFTYGSYTWQPVGAVVDLAGGMPSVSVTQANVCGIDTLGRVAMTPDGVRVSFKPTAKNQRVEKILLCLLGQKARMTGQCSLAAEVDASGHGREVLKSASGQVQLSANKGRIYQGGVWEKILAVTTIGRGSWNILADLRDDGLPYNTIDVKGDIRDGKLVLTEATVDAPSMKMVGEGTIDVNAGTVDVRLLAAPFKTTDEVVSRIPIISDVLGGSLLTVPIKVKGPLLDPAVTPLDPSEVGSGLLRVMTRIVKLPLRLLNPFLPADRKP